MSTKRNATIAMVLFTMFSITVILGCVYIAINAIKAEMYLPAFVVCFCIIGTVYAMIGPVVRFIDIIDRARAEGSANGKS